MQQRSDISLLEAVDTFAGRDADDSPDEGSRDRPGTPDCFSEIVGEAEWQAANDDDYRRAGAMPEPQDSIAAGLVRGLLWWAVLVSVGSAAFALVLR